MNSLTLCSHVFRYSKVCCFQLSSLVLYPPPEGFELALVTANDDWPVLKVVDWFAPQFRFPFHHIILTRNEVCRRAIGRNMVAKAATTDWVWFADCDYVFGDGCLASVMDSLGKLPREILLAWPESAMGTDDPAGLHPKPKGDSEIARCNPPQLIQIDQSLYTQRMNNGFAHGGIQIVRREFLHDHGYLASSHKHQQPVTNGEWPTERTPCDKAFRSQFTLAQRAKISVPELYRVRHSLHGGLTGVVDL